MSGTLRERQEDRDAVWRMGLITFSRVPNAVPRFVVLSASLAVSLALFGCAPAAPRILPGRAVAAAPGGSAYATVAAVRLINPNEAAAAAGSGSGPAADIMPAMGVSSAGTVSTEAPSEIIVRTDDGETLSVVQPNAADLVPGERVMVVPGGLPRLVPSVPSS